MKQFIPGLFALLVVSIPLVTHAQSRLPERIAVSADQTVLLVFPSPIKDADRGSNQIVMQAIKKAPHVLKVKAAVSDYFETSLSVLTESGKIYALRVCFAAEAPELVYAFTDDPPTSTPLLPEDPGSPSVIAANADSLLSQRPTCSYRQRAYGMRITCRAIKAKDGMLYFRFHLRNTSALPFTVQAMRFYQRDRKQPKRTSLLHQELLPLYVHPLTMIPARGDTTVVAAFRQFTIADHKRLIVELFEENGDRRVTLRLKGKHLLRANPF